MFTKKILGLTAAGALALTLVACGSSTGSSSGSSSSSSSMMTSSSMMASSPMMTSSSPMMTSSSPMMSSPMASSSAMAPSSGSMMTSGAGSSGMMSSAAGSSGMMSSAAGSSGMMTSGAASSSGMMSGSTGLVGSGCAAYAQANPTGAGSVSGMAADPVAVAAGHNPLLTTLVAAVSGKLNPKVNLVQTLDSSEFTVFAPIDSAFAKIPAATLASLKTDSATLTKILTYHVIAGQLSPSQIVGTHKTVEGDSVTVTGSGNSLKANSASVVCGGVKTKNATVYLIDSVLMPTK